MNSMRPKYTLKNLGRQIRNVNSQIIYTRKLCIAKFDEYDGMPCLTRRGGRMISRYIRRDSVALVMIMAAAAHSRAHAYALGLLRLANAGDGKVFCFVEACWVTLR